MLFNGGVAHAADVQPLRVLVDGTHPGDPEAGCGGTIARYVKEGHAVTGRLLGATPQFAGQVDAATEVNAARAAEFTKLIEVAKPDVVFTHWPIDAHADHRACASLTLGAWVTLGKLFPLYFYEVDLGSDTQSFRPGVYVDATDTEPLTRGACMAHQSQDPDGFYNRDHVPMMRFRGMECGRKLAEAFARHDPSPVGPLPR